MRQYFHKKIVFISAGVTTENIYDLVVEPGFICTYTRIAVENLSANMTEFRIGVDSSGVFYQCEEQDSPIAATLYWTPEPLYIFGGERLQVHITGASVGNCVEVIVQGYNEIEEILNA